MSFVYAVREWKCARLLTKCKSPLRCGKAIEFAAAMVSTVSMASACRAVNAGIPSGLGFTSVPVKEYLVYPKNGKLPSSANKSGKNFVITGFRALKDSISTGRDVVSREVYPEVNWAVNINEKKVARLTSSAASFP